MLIHVVGGDGVGDALKAKRAHHPVEQHRGVVGFDSTEHAFVDQIIAGIIDKRRSARQATHGVNNSVGIGVTVVPYSQGSFRHRA